MEKTMLIIGAGIAGLSAGCYGRMNGYRTRIFELHDKPGGLCTSWKRKGYTFDGCLHWLVGSAPGNDFYRIWQELGAVQGRKMVDHEEFARIEGAAGKTLIVYTDIDRLERHLLELAPADRKTILEFSRAVRRFTRLSMRLDKPSELYNWRDTLDMLRRVRPYAYSLWKYGKTSVQDFAQKFTDPFLRETFPLVFELPDFPMLAMLMTLAWMHEKSSGYPIGGSLEFSRAIERRYLTLAGELRYRARVEKILVEDHRAVGVRLADGSEHRGDFVISAADGHATLFQMLQGKYGDEKVRGYYQKLPIFDPIIQVTAGVGVDLSAAPHSVMYPLPEPVTIAGREQKRIGVMHYGFDPTLAPPGKSVLKVMFPADYDYWKKLGENRELYEDEKEKISDQVVGLLEQRFPQIRGKVEVVDVATPLTYERYTGNWRGSMEGWMITTRSLFLQMKKTLAGLENFYQIGQWVQPGGGVPPAALSGREVIQIICHREGKSFQTSLPAA